MATRMMDEALSRTFSLEYRALPACADLVSILAQIVDWSCWFEVEPLPFNTWRIRVKVENTERLAELIGYHSMKKGT